MNEEKTNLETGLTSNQVEQRIQAGEVNKAVDDQFKTNKQIIRENLFTYFNLIFLVLSILLIFVGAYKDLTFLPVIVLNTVIGIVQEIRAKKILSKLNVMNTTEIVALRDSKEEKVPIEKLVKGDLVLLKTGDQIPADGKVVKGNIRVNESLLTGESDEITKEVGDDLMSGSFVVSGSAYMQLEKVGKESYISKLTIKAKAMGSREQSEMVRSINKLIKWVGIIIIPLGIALFSMSFFVNHMSLYRSIVSMEAAIIGMIPEGLYLLTTIALALSAVRLARKQVMLHDMKSVETLARVNVLCVDKTGTITENCMSVTQMHPCGENADIAEIQGLVSDFAAAQDSDNETMAAVKNYFREPTGALPLKVTGFSSEFKYSSVTMENGAYVMGAPEFVLKEEYDKHRAVIESYSRKGYRVLVFGEYSGHPDGKALEQPIRPICFITLSNPIRANAPETFRYFAEQGVEIKVISGDNPVTVSEVAKQAGIRNAGNYIDASTLTTESSINDAVKRYTVFGRVTPDQKRQFVKALKRAGKTVAMTGDGVNDVLALKDADCSVAMASGSDAAAQAAQLVLLESDFSKMPEVVAEGRKVVNNLERSGSLFLVKNIFSLILSILSMCFGIVYPLKPAQISLVSMFTIGIPAFFLSQMPNRDLIKGKFMTNILLKALPAGVTDTIVVAAMIYFGNIFNVGRSDIATASTILLSMVGLMIVFEICKPMDVYKMWLWIGCTVGLIFCMLFVSDFFSISSMSNRCILLCINFSIIAEPTLRYLTKFLRWFKEWLLKGGESSQSAEIRK